MRRAGPNSDSAAALNRAEFATVPLAKGGNRIPKLSAIRV